MTDQQGKEMHVVDHCNDSGAAPTVEQPQKPEESEVTLCRCANCDWEGDIDDADQINHFWERHQPGDTVAAGQCPECEALVFLVTQAELDHEEQSPFRKFLLLMIVTATILQHEHEDLDTFATLMLVEGVEPLKSLTNRQLGEKFKGMYAQDPKRLFELTNDDINKQRQIVERYVMKVRQMREDEAAQTAALEAESASKG